MKLSVQLLEFLECTPLPWLYYDYTKEKLIVVVDNHMMGIYRNCPQHFINSMVLGYAKKSDTVIDSQQRIWFLDFGIVLHKMFELYYQNFRKPDFDVTKWATDRAVAEWNEMGMDIHSEHKEYKLIGGVYGLAGILMQYSMVMSPQNEKLRIIGTEVAFGRRGEVPLHIGEDIEIYLAGRLDLVVDDGYFICPMDHKSKGYFSGDPALEYETDEGPTGYVYALSKILPTLVPEEQILKRDCSKILMNLISKKATATPEERFKRVAIRKTSYQLEEYQDRMLSTVMNLVSDMERFANSTRVQRNTTACFNWHRSLCQYKDVCRQQSRDAEQGTLNNGFIKLPIWNTEAVKPTT